MNFKRSLPPDLYQLATHQYPDRIKKIRATKQGELRLDSKWRMSLDSSCGQLAHLAADDLRRFLGHTFGIRMRRGPSSDLPCLLVTLRKLPETAPSAIS